MGGFHTLDREQAARILFADRLDDPETDFTTDAFESGADIAESLASWFGFTDDDYAAIRHARKLRAIAEQGSLHADPNGEEGYAHRGDPCSWESAAAYAQRVMSGEAA